MRGDGQEPDCQHRRRRRDGEEGEAPTPFVGDRHHHTAGREREDRGESDRGEPPETGAAGNVGG